MPAIARSTLSALPWHNVPHTSGTESTYAAIILRASGNGRKSYALTKLGNHAASLYGRGPGELSARHALLARRDT